MRKSDVLCSVKNKQSLSSEKTCLFLTAGSTLFIPLDGSSCNKMSTEAPGERIGDI